MLRVEALSNEFALVRPCVKTAHHLLDFVGLPRLPGVAVPHRLDHCPRDERERLVAQFGVE